MSGWIRVDTRFTTHPKVIDIGPLGEALWLRGLCYAGEHLTDGFVPAGFIRRMNDLDGVDIAETLVAAGLWTHAPNGYQVSGAFADGPFAVPDRPLAHLWSVIRQRIFERDDFTCQYCGHRGCRLECDHVIPVSRGGAHDDSNLVTACFDCNRSKRDKLVEEWLT